MALPISTRGITAMKASPDGDYLAVTGRDGIMRILDSSNGTLITGFKVRFLPSKTVAFSFSFCNGGRVKWFPSSQG
jgi:hypothetical protein